MSALLIEISPVSVDVGITFLTLTFMLTPSKLSHFQPNLKPIAMNRVRKRLFKNQLPAIYKTLIQATVDIVHSFLFNLDTKSQEVVLKGI